MSTGETITSAVDVPAALQRRAVTWLLPLVVAVVGAAFRLVPYLTPGVILGEREYDDGVMFSGALLLLRGRMPYADFVYLHPPGSLLALAPAAAAADVVGEPAALAAARVAAIAVGSLNVFLIGMLLRRRGAAAVLVGAGAYAVWPVVVSTERTILLEPALDLCLLVALACIASRRMWTMCIAGAFMGIALSTKYWAIVDVVLLAAVIAMVLGARALGAYLASGAIAAAAIMGPFFVVAPREMWKLTVETQLTRPPSRVPFLDRLATLSPLDNFASLDAVAPPLLWGILILGLLVLALLPLARGLRDRTPPHALADPVWWGIIAAVHATVLAVAGVYFYHYGVWMLAPLVLTVGSVVGGLAARRARQAVAGVMIVVIVVFGTAETRRTQPTAVDSAVLTTWAAERACVWGLPSVLLAADAVRRSIEHDCPFDVDPYGVALVLRDAGSPAEGFVDNSAWQASARDQLDRSDGALFDSAGQYGLFSPSTKELLLQEFRLDELGGSWELWDRSTR